MMRTAEIELAPERSETREEKRAGDWRRPARNAGKLMLGRVVQAVCSLSYLAFATRALGPEGFGQLILIHSLSLAVAQLARFESWQSVVRFGTPALRDEKPDRLRRVVGFGLLLDLAGIVRGVLVYAVLIHLLGAWFGLSPELRFVALLYGVAVVTVLNSSGSATGLLHLQDRFGPLAVVATLEPVIRLAGAAAIFFLGGGLGGFLLLWLLALSATHVGVIVSAFTILARRGANWRFRFERAAWTQPEPGMWRYAWGTHWVCALNVAQDYLPTLATGGVIGATGAGLLKTARLFSDVLVVSTAKLLVPALLPEFARLKETEGRALAARINWMTFGGFLLVFALLAVFGKDLISLIAGGGFVGAYPAMLWLAASGVVAASSFSYETFLTAQGAIRRVVWSNSIAIALYFAALVALLPMAGVEGMGMAAAASAFVRAVLLRWHARREHSYSPVPA
jgi:O-antigen/teichoic acid export membrane protein